MKHEEKIAFVLCVGVFLGTLALVASVVFAEPTRRRHNARWIQQQSFSSVDGGAEPDATASDSGLDCYSIIYSLSPGATDPVMDLDCGDVTLPATIYVYEEGGSSEEILCTSCAPFGGSFQYTCSAVSNAYATPFFGCPVEEGVDAGSADAAGADADAGVGDTGTATIAGNTIREIPSYGQSNSIGSGASAGVSTTNGSPTAAPWYNLRWDGSNLVTPISPGTNGTEFHYYGMMNELASEELSGSNSYRRLISYSGGVGSQTYAQLRVGTGNWNNFVSETSQMHTACEALYEPTYTCELANYLVWIQGENDQSSGTSRATYVSNLNELWTEWCAVAQAAPYNLDTCPAVVIVQAGAPNRVLSTATSQYMETSEIVAAGYEACRDYPERFLCAPPGYSRPMIASDLHYTAAGHRLNGLGIARVARTHDLQRATYTSFLPNAASIACTNNTLIVPFNSGGLGGTGVTRDTSAVTARANDGFDYTDSGTDVPAIASVAYGSNSATITLSRNCVAPARISYAWVGESTCSGGSTSTCGSGGNVRRSTSETTYIGTDYDFLQPFDEDVQTVTGSESPVWSYANTGSLDVSNTTSWLSARSTTVTAGASDITWTFRFRTSSFADAGIFEQWLTPTNRMFSFRTVTSGRLRIFLSGNGSTLYQCTTAASSFAINTAYQIVVTLSGSTLTLYSNGSTVTCTTDSGTVPASLYANGNAPINIMGGSATTGNQNALVSHVGVIRRALSAAEVTTIYNGGTASDLRTYNFSHYWHGQGAAGAAWEDVGRAASRPLKPYGTGNTFSGTAL